MKVVSAPEIRAAVRPVLALEAVRAALIAHAEARTAVPAPIHLSFPDAGGDAHVKVGMLVDEDTFTVKLATGFYANPARGLPSNGGAMLVVSARTGEVLALLDDHGWLTAIRTAAAAALATDAIVFSGPLTVGILGTGVQAGLVTEWLRELRPVERVLIAGRREHAARALAERIDGATAAALCDVLEHADAVVTATASTTPLFRASQAKHGTRFTAVGADMPGKHELPEALFAGARVIVDDLDQASDHGDLAHALASDDAKLEEARLLGDVLRDRPSPSSDTTVVDLTGVGALDAGIAQMVLRTVLG